MHEIKIYFIVKDMIAIIIYIEKERGSRRSINVIVE